MSRSTREIVVIAEKDDAHIPYVQDHLSRGLIVVDPFASPLSFWRGAGCEATVWGAWCLDGRDDAGARRAEVGSVWLRKPLARLRSVVEVNLAEEHRHYARAAITRHADALLASFAGAHWVSDYYAIERAANKALQLEVAHELGLSVPDTLITSDPSAAASFL